MVHRKMRPTKRRTRVKNSMSDAGRLQSRLPADQKAVTATQKEKRERINPAASTAPELRAGDSAMTSTIALHEGAPSPVFLNYTLFTLQGGESVSGAMVKANRAWQIRLTLTSDDPDANLSDQMCHVIVLAKKLGTDQRQVIADCDLQPAPDNTLDVMLPSLPSGLYRTEISVLVRGGSRVLIEGLLIQIY